MPGPPASQSSPEVEGAFEGPESFGAPPPMPGPAVPPSTGAMGLDPDVELRQPRSSPDAREAIFGPIVPDVDAESRRRTRRRSKESPPPKPPKSPTKRA